MIASLADRDSTYLPREQFGDEKSQIEYHFYGVGMTVGLTESGLLEVQAPIPRTPAFRAGIQTGDIITGINHCPPPLSLTEAVGTIRGPIDTKVILTISRDGEQRDVSITRGEIPVFCVFDSRMMDKEIGYISIDTYISTSSVDDIIQNLSKLKSAKGIIVDLRGNCGGRLSTAIDIATIFLEHGEIATVVDRDGHINRSYKVDKERLSQSGRSAFRLPLFNQPLVIITDGSTARCTEIVVAALKDNHRAEIVGEKTRGRKHEHGMFRLPNGAGITLSTFRYLSPLNTDLVLGVEPDHLVELSKQDKIAGRGPWYTYGRGTKVDSGRSPTDGKDIQLAAAYKIMQQRLAVPAK